MIDVEKTAIVHYWFDDYRGGEKVIEALCEMFPHSDLFTNIYKPEKLPDTITKHKVKTTFISKLPLAYKFYRHYLLLMPLALTLLNLKKYDIIISSESGPAKYVRKRKDALHICYCHSPMRYIWDMRGEYVYNKGLFFKSIWSIIAGALRVLDRKSAEGVDYFIANSNFIAARIRKYYKRKSIVLYPPVNIRKYCSSKVRKDYYLCVAQLVPYKKVELLIKAFNILGLQLYIVGGGNSVDELMKIANDNVHLLGKVSDYTLKCLYEKCKAFVYAGKEDFGIVFVEACAAGAPVIAYGKGGVKDIIDNNRTGLLFMNQDVESIVNKIKSFEEGKTDLLSNVEISKNAEKFSSKQFKKNIYEFIEKCLLVS